MSTAVSSRLPRDLVVVNLSMVGGIHRVKLAFCSSTMRITNGLCVALTKFILHFRHPPLSLDSSSLVHTTTLETPLAPSGEILPCSSAQCSLLPSYINLDKVFSFCIYNSEGNFRERRHGFHCKPVSSLMALGVLKTDNRDLVHKSAVPASPKMENCGDAIKWNESGSATGRRVWHRGLVDERRIRCLTNDVQDPCRSGRSVVCFLQRDLRLDDNWALVFAQDAALCLGVPLHVIHLLIPRHLHQMTRRHLSFNIGGLKELFEGLERLQIKTHCFAVENRKHDDAAMLNEAAAAAEAAIVELSAKLVVCDFSPLRLPNELTNRLAEICSLRRTPLFAVDARNVVPLWFVSGKQEYAARTFRPRVMPLLHQFLNEFPVLREHPHRTEGEALLPGTAGPLGGLWGPPASVARLQEVDEEVTLPPCWVPGSSAARRALALFCARRLDYTHRNEPLKVGQSELSPYIQFGQLSPQRCVMEILSFKENKSAAEAAAALAKTARAAPKDPVDLFVEQLVVRRELAENFVFYNPNYDSLAGAPEWARNTLQEHSVDERPFLYSQHEFENACTHDELWNAAQLQLKREAKMHGFLRMYWAKKILEWSSSPQQAIQIALYLNDKYSLDGTSPNGYVGCLWSIAGLHDRPFFERPIFGRVRYMSLEGCKGKFPVHLFVSKYKGASTNACEVLREKRLKQVDVKTGRLRPARDDEVTPKQN